MTAATTANATGRAKKLERNLREQPQEVVGADSEIPTHAGAIRLHALAFAPLQLRTVDHRVASGLFFWLQSTRAKQLLDLGICVRPLWGRWLAVGPVAAAGGAGGRDVAHATAICPAHP